MKRMYNPEQQQARLRFARVVVRLSKAALREKRNMAMNGVVLAMLPTGTTDRLNYWWDGFRFMWRKRGEANAPPLAGADAEASPEVTGYPAVGRHLRRRICSGTLAR